MNKNMPALMYVMDTASIMGILQQFKFYRRQRIISIIQLKPSLKTHLNKKIIDDTMNMKHEKNKKLCICTDDSINSSFCNCIYILRIRHIVFFLSILYIVVKLYRDMFESAPKITFSHSFEKKVS